MVEEAGWHPWIADASADVALLPIGKEGQIGERRPALASGGSKKTMRFEPRKTTTPTFLPPCRRFARPPSSIIVAFAVAVAAVGREVQHRATAGRVPPGDDPHQVLPVRRAMKASRLDIAWRYYHTVPTAFP